MLFDMGVHTDCLNSKEMNLKITRHITLQQSTKTKTSKLNNIKIFIQLIQFILINKKLPGLINKFYQQQSFNGNG